MSSDILFIATGGIILQKMKFLKAKIDIHKNAHHQMTIIEHVWKDGNFIADKC